MKLETMKRLAVLAAVLVAGCASYYRVTDPGTGRAYYTEKVERKNGTVMFKDAKTGAEVTMTSSVVLEVSGDEFRKGVGQ
ncbi:MAG: hypothetical protein ACREVS_18350 [Burkholderiales bacterium]